MFILHPEDGLLVSVYGYANYTELTTYQQEFVDIEYEDGWDHCWLAN